MPVPASVSGMNANAYQARHGLLREVLRTFLVGAPGASRGAGGFDCEPEPWDPPTPRDQLPPALPPRRFARARRPDATHGGAGEVHPACPGALS